MLSIYDIYLAQIARIPNKNSRKVLALKKKVDEHIGGLRLTAMKSKGKKYARICNRQANYYEKRLDYSLRIVYEN